MPLCGMNYDLNASGCHCRRRGGRLRAPPRLRVRRPGRWQPPAAAACFLGGGPRGARGARFGDLAARPSGEAIMVGNPVVELTPIPHENLAEAMRDSYPELEAVREAAADPVYLVGGAVRDLLLGRGRADIDLVVVGDAGGARRPARRRDASSTSASRPPRSSSTATRSTSPPPEPRPTRAPGPCRRSSPAGSIEADLGRRDFTINAMAVPLAGEARLIDPHGGRADLENGLLRILHRGSFEDDPTRALRAARYAARLGLALEPETERAAPRGRPRDGLGRPARGRAAAAGGRTERARGIRAARGVGAGRAARGRRRAGETGRRAARASALEGFAPQRDRAVREAAPRRQPGGERALAGSDPARPSEAVALAAGLRARSSSSLARALGAELARRYLERVARGRARDRRRRPDRGRRRRRARPSAAAWPRRCARKLDGELSGRERGAGRPRSPPAREA